MRDLPPGRSAGPEADRPRRCFVALAVGDAVRAQLRAVQASLRQRLPDGALRWTGAGQVHLTLAFLGDLLPAEVARAERALEHACRRHAPFELTTAAPGVFPSPRRPSVVWLGVGGDTVALAALQREVRLRLAPLGRASEERPFRPHLTLARVRSGRVREALVAALRALPPFEPVAWPVERAALVASELRPAGAVHTPIREVRLGG